jgi:isopentenyldiphosphate isomerase
MRRRQQEMEIFDVVDDEGRPTGETVSRQEAHEKGIRHRTAHIWVIRRGPEKGGIQILLQKRAMDKDSFPGQYDTSSAGHIHAGDEPRISAVRELQEELGIAVRPEELKFAGKFRVHYTETFHGKPFLDDEVAFVYVCDRPVTLSELKLQKEEVEAAGWFDLEETWQAVLRHDPMYCVPRGGLEVLRAYMRESDFFV